MNKLPNLLGLLFFTLWVSGIPLPSARAADGSGLQTAVAVDIVGRAGKAGLGPDGRTDETPGRVEVREAEALFFAPVDQLFDGLLNLAAHQENGEATFEIHEAYIGTSKLIPRTRARVGQYFLGFGRLNQIHRHDWPFISAPRVQRSFFDVEGVLDTGLEAGYLAPLPFVLDLTGGITNGWTFGHSHDIGDPPLLPTHYLRAATYLDLPGEGGVQPALNYVNRKAADGTNFTYWGTDITAKWRESQTLKFLLQSEVWLRLLKPSASDREDTLGLYVFPQYGFSQHVLLGVRFDYYSTLNLKNANGSNAPNSDVAIVPTLTYKASEFSTLRAGYTFEIIRENNITQSAQQALELQATFILGAHPAHDF